MQSINGEFLSFCMGFDLFACPAAQGVDLKDVAVDRVKLQRHQVGPCDALFPAHAGDPTAVSNQGSL